MKLFSFAMSCFCFNFRLLIITLDVFDHTAVQSYVELLGNKDTRRESYQMYDAAHVEWIDQLNSLQRARVEFT